jgi:hypothetical protein
MGFIPREEKLRELLVVYCVCVRWISDPEVGLPIK